MLVVFLKDWDDGKLRGKEYDVELSLGRRLCENGVCLSSVDYNKKKSMERAANAEAKRVAAIKKKAKVKRKVAVSKKATKRERAIKL